MTVPQEDFGTHPFTDEGVEAARGGALLKVAAFLPPRLLTQLRHALAGEREVLAADSWHDLEGMIKRTALRAVIIDPESNGVVDSAAVVRLLTRYPSLATIAYVSLGPATFSGIAHLSKLGLDQVILHRFDDSVERIRRTVDSVGSDPMVKRVFEAVQPSVACLPLPLALAVQQMFEEPQRFVTALDLSTASGVPTVRMYQSFAQAKLTSPKNLLVAARALRAFSYLRDPGYSIGDVALKLGYFHPRILGKHSLKVFGLKPARSRQRMSEAQAVEKVVEFVRRTDEAAI